MMMIFNDRLESNSYNNHTVETTELVQRAAQWPPLGYTGIGHSTFSALRFILEYKS